MRTILFGLLFASSTASAGYYSSGTMSYGVDDGYKEIFGDSIENYSAAGLSNLGVCHDGNLAFVNRMIPEGFSNYLLYTDNDAWSTDYENAASDDYYNDRADISYFSGHGSSNTFYFSNTYGYNHVTVGETRWGNMDVEVVALDACNVLDNAGRTSFSSQQLNDGVHWLLGFHTNAQDVTTTADLYGYYLDQGYYIDSAWIAAQQAGHSSSYIGANMYFRNSSCNPWYDRASSMSCDPTSGSWSTSYTYTL